MIDTIAAHYAMLADHKTRLENLEKDIKRIVDVHHNVVKLEVKLVDRISRLENRVENKELESSRKSILPTERDLTKIIRDHLPNHDIEITFDPGMKDESAYMAIRCPRQSKYMSFKQAVDALLKGYKITRKDWSYDKEHYDVYVKLGDSNSSDLDIYDLEANDWYIIEYERS